MSLHVLLLTGLLTNDSLVEEPLFTVPLNANISSLQDISLCYEVYGSTGSVFNLISDRCVTVNALYASMDNVERGNIISSIGILAVDTLGRCVGVTVSLDNQCMPILRVGSIEQQVSSYSSHGVIIYRRHQRVRVSVPNCENVQLVMWITCGMMGSQQHLSLRVTRGLNLRPTSHGLIGMGIVV